MPTPVRYLLVTHRDRPDATREVIDMQPQGLSIAFEPEQIARLDAGNPVVTPQLVFVDLVALHDAVVSPGQRTTGAWTIA